MAPMTQKAKAELFQQLHHGPDILVLPNAWDVVSARIFELAGFPAIATTSAGIAAALGYPDGQRISRREMLEVVQRIAHGVALPVTADMEAGYGNTPEAVAETARSVLDAGAIGMNFEDKAGQADAPLADMALQVAKIQAIREVAASRGIPFVLNARTDVFLAAVGEPESRLAHAIQRANAYRQAGADCLFIPGVRDSATIAQLAREINGPINILAVPGTPPIAELARLGVARVSVGSGPMRATLALVRRIAQELKEHGTYAAFTEATISHGEVNRLFERTYPHP